MSKVETVQKILSLGCRITPETNDWDPGQVIPRRQQFIKSDKCIMIIRSVYVELGDKNCMQFR